MRDYFIRLVVEGDGHFQHLEQLFLEGSELGGEENDVFLLDDLVSFDSTKDSDNVIERGVRAGSVFGIKWQAGKGAAFHGLAQLPFDQSGHHESHDMHM